MRLSVAIILMGFVASTPAGEPGTSATRSVEVAKIMKLNPVWPGAVDREALVILGFDILASGKVANIRLLDGGFHEKRFVKAAIQALETGSFEPRRVNGVAVDSPDLQQVFKFAIHQMEPGITTEFRYEASKVEELLRKGDYAGAEFHAQWMLAEKVTLNYEYALLQAELAETYAWLGKPYEALRKVRKATERTKLRQEFLQLLDKPRPNSPSNYLLDRKAIVRLLDLRMRLLATQGLALEAMQSYYELAGLEELPPDHPLSKFATQLTAAIRGGGILRGKVEIGEDGRWRQYLSRRRFSIDNVKGGINSLDLRCEAGSRNLDYVPGEEWVVPEGWGLCVALIGAEPGASFEFVEFPDTPAAQVGQVNL